MKNINKKLYRMYNNLFVWSFVAVDHRRDINVLNNIVLNFNVFICCLHLNESISSKLSIYIKSLIILLT